MSTDDTYNGWTNRETWAVKLYIDNDQGWYEQVRELAQEAVALDEGTDRNTAYALASTIKDNVEQMLTVDGYAEMTGEKQLPAELSRIAEDVGSLYRVNWDEIAESVLSDIAEG